MHISESHVALLGEVRDLFARAEGLAKSLETLKLDGEIIGLFVPSINELRYAGKHVIDSLLAEDSLSDIEIRKAQNHCQRAIYDACDAYIQVLILEIDMFQKDFSEVTITDVLPKYFDILEARKKAALFLEKGRQNDETREHFYERALEERKNIENLCAELPWAREELNKKIASLQNARRDRVIGILGVLVALISLAIQFFL